jgi:hypothetical protein
VRAWIGGGGIGERLAEPRARSSRRACCRRNCRLTAAGRGGRRCRSSRRPVSARRSTGCGRHRRACSCRRATPCRWPASSRRRSASGAAASR